MTVPFTKAHGARNDFLLTWAPDGPDHSHASIAVAICDRNTGVGADGWMLVHPPHEATPASIRLYNSDGSEAELSGNGTRCAAALLISAGHFEREVPIVTGAGPKQLRLLSREDNRFLFEMNMGAPAIIDLHFDLDAGGGIRDTTTLDVGNPQCAVFVQSFGFDWRAVGAEIESHPHFRNRTNVSFVCVVDRHTVDVRFYERGAGVTMSSGTGSTGAAAAALARGYVDNPVTVLTPAGPLELRWEGTQVYLVGPAEITARGEFYFEA
jgi:diaminopimelate epimerase